MGGGGKMRRMMHTPDLDEPPLPRAPTCPHSFSFYLFPCLPLGCGHWTAGDCDNLSF